MTKNALINNVNSNGLAEFTDLSTYEGVTVGKFKVTASYTDTNETYPNYADSTTDTPVTITISPSISGTYSSSNTSVMTFSGNAYGASTVELELTRGNSSDPIQYKNKTYNVSVDSTSGAWTKTITLGNKNTDSPDVWKYGQITGQITYRQSSDVVCTNPNKKAVTSLYVTSVDIVPTWTPVTDDDGNATGAYTISLDDNIVHFIPSGETVRFYLLDTEGNTIDGHSPKVSSGGTVSTTFKNTTLTSCKFRITYSPQDDKRTSIDLTTDTYSMGGKSTSIAAIFSPTSTTQGSIRVAGHITSDLDASGTRIKVTLQKNGTTIDIPQGNSTSVSALYPLTLHGNWTTTLPYLDLPVLNSTTNEYNPQYSVTAEVYAKDDTSYDNMLYSTSTIVSVSNLSMYSCDSSGKGVTSFEAVAGKAYTLNVMVKSYGSTIGSDLPVYFVTRQSIATSYGKGYLDTTPETETDAKLNYSDITIYKATTDTNSIATNTSYSRKLVVDASKDLMGNNYHNVMYAFTPGNETYLPCWCQFTIYTNADTTLELVSNTDDNGDNIGTTYDIDDTLKVQVKNNSSADVVSEGSVSITLTKE